MFSQVLGLFSKPSERESYLPSSKAGEAIGLNSVVMVNMPLNGRSECGLVTSADMRASTLRSPRIS